MRQTPFKTVALLARKPGLNVLKDLLVKSPLVDLKAVFTHANLPKAEGGSTRDDLENFRDVCDENNIAFHCLDFPHAKDISPYLPTEDLDMLIALSWRYLVPQHVLNRFKIGSINLHRGYLPTYAGAEPVLHAIQANEKSISITAHEMTVEIDGGDKLGEVHYSLPAHSTALPTAQYVEHIKEKIEPLYAPLCELALQTWKIRA